MSNRKLPIVTKIAYGAVDFGPSASYTIIAFFLLKFLTDVAHIKPQIAGTMLFACKIWDAIIDPTIGHFSDRVDTRWGRRRPFFLFGAVPYGLSFALLWAIPGFRSEWLLAVYVMLLTIVHYTSGSLVQIPYLSLSAELTEDYNERTSLQAYRMAFNITGGLVAAVLPSMIVNSFADARAGYAVMAVFFGIALAITPLSAFFGVREPKRPPSSDSAEKPLPLFRSVVLCFKNRAFVTAMGMYLFTWLGVGVMAASLTYYLDYWLGMADKQSIVMALIFVPSILFLPVWAKISEKGGKKNAYYLGLGSLALVLLGLVFLPQGPSAAVYVVAAMAGFGVSAAHVIPSSILPDVIEFDELMTGRRREGTYFGIIQFLRQLADAAAPFVVGVALWLAGYEAGARQTPAALWTIRLLAGTFPGVAVLAGIMALRRYPIDQKEHLRIQEELAAVRQHRS